MPRKQINNYLYFAAYILNEEYNLKREFQS